MPVAVLIGGITNAGRALQGPDFPSGLVGTLQGLFLFTAVAGEVLVRYRIRRAPPRRPPPPRRDGPTMNNALLVVIATQAVFYGTPLLFAALGELLAERAGVLNLGVEGMMLIGAVTAAAASQHLGGNAWIVLPGAVLAGMLAGAALALVHAFLCITLRANQTVTGLAITIFAGAFGLSSYLASVSKVAERVPATRWQARCSARRPTDRRPDRLQPEPVHLRLVGDGAAATSPVPHRHGLWRSASRRAMPTR